MGRRPIGEEKGNAWEPDSPKPRRKGRPTPERNALPLGYPAKNVLRGRAMEERRLRQSNLPFPPENPLAPSESDSPPWRFRQVHEIPDGLEDDLKFLVMGTMPAFQFVQAAR